MNTGPRETMIALRARRTAFQIVAAFLNSRRGGTGPVTCADCGSRFLPTEKEDARTPRCAACILRTLHPHPLGHHTRPSVSLFPAAPLSSCRFKPVRLPDFLKGKKP